jgi:cytochrome c oxidase subunit 1
VTSTQPRPLAEPAAERADRFEWLVTTDHKRIGLLLVGTSLVLFYVFGAVAMTMRTQLARPDQHLLSPQLYNQLFTLHGTGMIALVVTPIALGLGVYLVPLQIGAPTIAGPRVTLLGYWLYIGGALSIILGCAMPDGADSGWWGYIPLANSVYSPGAGQNLWILGVVLAACGMLLLSASLTWTILTRRAPGMTMMRLPVFTWSMLVTCFMGVTAFPSLLAAMGLEIYDRIYHVNSNFWNVLYEHMFWFYGHPVVYIMFFPFVGCVAEVLATFAARRFFAYYSLTSNFLAIPAGVEYFGFLGTLIGGRLRYRTPMLFALAFIPQFLIGGLTGIMVANPTIDYHVNDSYFVVAHFHYTLLAGSLFGFFAGFYFWLPKATGIMFSEKLGRLHFLFMVIGTNLTFLPMFGLGVLGMPRRVASYPASMGIGTLNLISSIGAFILGFSMLFLIYNLYISARRKVPAPPDPWLGTTLEWATSSPPPRFNFNAQYPVPKIRGYAPLLDLREERAKAQQGSSDAARVIPPEDS